MLTHFDEKGNAIMVDVSDKEASDRFALAKGKIILNDRAFAAVKSGTVKKGDVLNTARIAGIMAAKRTYELIPLCHILPLTFCGIEFNLFDGAHEIECECTVKTNAKTGVEMEALTGVNVALLTIYDMCKALDRTMRITDIRLVKKTGGKSGDIENA